MPRFRNLNQVDQLIRLAIAGVCIYFGFIDSSALNDRLLALCVGIFGVLNVIAGVMGFCPVYKLAGINTYVAKADR